jgi:hypothetical protein
MGMVEVKIAGRDVATSDVGILAGGLVVFVFSFMPWLGFDWYYYRSITHVGWASGWSAVLGILAGLVAAGLVAARVFGNVRVPALGPVGPALLTVILGGLSVFFTLLRLLTASPYDTKFGIYVALIGSAVLTAFSVRSLRASGETIPGRVAGATAWGPQPPYGGYTQQPPYGGYQPGAPYATPQPAAPTYGAPPPATYGPVPGYPTAGGYAPQPSGYPGYGAQPPVYDGQQAPSYPPYPSFGQPAGYGPQPPAPGYDQQGQPPTAPGPDHPYGHQPN